MIRFKLKSESGWIHANRRIALNSQITRLPRIAISIGNILKQPPGRSLKDQLFILNLHELIWLD